MVSRSRRFGSGGDDLFVSVAFRFSVITVGAKKATGGFFRSNDGSLAFFAKEF